MSDVWQVKAFIKQLPRILPRSSLLDKAQLTVCSSPPSLAPKDTSGVGGASGPGGPVIAMATLSQQQGGPVPVMILPQGCLSYEREKVVVPPQPPPPPQQHTTATPTSVVQKARGSASKRPLEVMPAGGAVGGSVGSAAIAPPVKRKRGRPRKLRPEDAPPPSPPAPPSQPPIITSLTGGVIQKASSSSSSSSQPVLELVIQDQSGLVLSPLPPVSEQAHRLMEHRGVVVQCQPGGAVEADRHSRPPLLLLHSPPNPSWEVAAGRTPMVEVIQKAPRPSNNSSGAPTPAAHLLPPPLPLPTLHEEQGEVEITLTPIELHVTTPLPSASTTSSSAAAASSSSITAILEEELSSSTSSNREGH